MIQRNRGLLLLLLLSAILLLLGVGHYGVVESSDARYAEIAREMYRSGDWLRPDLLGIHHYHKPPLTYQITALGYTLFGVDPFGARFFLQMAILIQMLLVYLLSLEFLDDRRVALWASAIYFSFPLVLSASRNLTTDAFLTTFVLLALYSWVRYRREGRWGWLYLFTISLGLGFLTKGPVVFIVPALFALFYNRIAPSPRPWSRHHLLAWGLFFLLAASWFVYLITDNPAFWDYFIGKQTIDRFSHNVFHRSEPFWYFLVLAPLLGLPWLPALPWMLHKRKPGGELPDRIVNALLWTVALGIFFFSLSTSKRILYILPFYPLLAVATALLLRRIGERDARRLLGYVTGYAVLILLILALAPWVQDKVDLPLWTTPLALLLLPLLYGLARSPRLELRSRSVAIAFLSSATLLLTATALFAHSPRSFRIATPAVNWIRDHGLADRTILVYDRRLPSVAFGLDRPIVSLYDGSRDLNREVQFEKDERWKETLYNLKKPSERQRLLRRMQREKTLLLTYRKQIPQWLKKHYRHEETIGRWRICY